MERFRVKLEALDPERGRFRAYRIDAGIDLLGDWLVDVTYGRIGSRGRTVRYLAGDEADARKIVHHCLQRRTTAPKRIGIAYQLRELDDPKRWMATYTGLHHGVGDAMTSGKLIAVPASGSRIFAGDLADTSPASYSSV
jgi:hypothetical protein